MPNWVTNELSFSDRGDEILKAIRADESTANEYGEVSDFDFNKVISMPEGLHVDSGTSSDLALALVTDKMPTYCQDEGDFKKRVENCGGEEKLLEIGKQLLKNIEETGCPTWYEWANQYWGTKWNACRAVVSEGVLTFNTAWASPIPVIERLSEMFPDVSITLRYADEDTGHNTGHLVYFDGELDDDFSPDDGSPKAYELAFELTGAGEYYEWSEENQQYVYVEE
jgi:hypothetical protein